MRFLARSYYDNGYYRRKKNRYLFKIISLFFLIWTIAYILSCIFLYFRQDYLVYRFNRQIPISFPQNLDVELKYRDVSIGENNSSARIHGRWFDTPKQEQPVIAIPNEPVNILNESKTILYLGGRGGSKTQYNSLARIQAFQQLGFSVLAIDDRGYGWSKGVLSNESRLYEDSQAAWNYLIDRRKIPPQDIIIYGESLGGAIAIDLAIKKPHAAGLIVQSSFTSMPAQIKQLRPGLKIFPLELILGSSFNSVDKVRSLQIPVLFLHGTEDSIVNYRMSRQLYYAAPEPKALFYVSGGEHFRLDQPGKNSYLVAIENFIDRLIDKSGD